MQRSIECLTLAAEKGNPHAQFSLACAYKSGDGVAKDLKKAFELFLEAAKQGLI